MWHFNSFPATFGAQQESIRLHRQHRLTWLCSTNTGAWQRQSWTRRSEKSGKTNLVAGESTVDLMIKCLGEVLLEGPKTSKRRERRWNHEHNRKCSRTTFLCRWERCKQRKLLAKYVTCMQWALSPLQIDHFHTVQIFNYLFQWSCAFQGILALRHQT